MIWTAIILGALIGAGVVMVVIECLPKQPKLSSALVNLGQIESNSTPRSFKNSLARLMQQRPLAPLAISSKDLALVNVTLNQHQINQALMGLLGFALIPFLGIVFTLALGLPLAIMALSIPLGLGLGLLLIFATNLTVTQKATESRKEFSRAVASYIELVGAARKRQLPAQIALEAAAEASNLWVFQRIREELQLSKYKGTRPWDSLRELSNEIGVNELADLGDIMKIAGENGAPVYEALRTRGKGLRIELLNETRAKANADSEKMTVPMSFMGLIFIALIFVPPAAKLLST